MEQRIAFLADHRQGLFPMSELCELAARKESFEMPDDVVKGTYESRDLVNRTHSHPLVSQCALRIALKLRRAEEQVIP